MLPSHRRLSRYGPLIVWAALIFIGSTSLLSGSNTNPYLRLILLRLVPNAGETMLHIFYLTVRKAGHLTEYAILAVLAARSFVTSPRSFLRNYWFAASMLFVIAYAASDEFHQSFVPARGPSVEDVMIDAVGGVIGLMIYWLLRRYVSKTEIQP